MARPLPSLAAPTWETPPFRWISVDISVITPMFGGSYEARHCDPDHPVRAASVRGHLRFWWRATIGARYDTPEALHEAEARVWGSASQAGQVALRVETLSAGRSVAFEEVVGRTTARSGPRLRYFLFPFQGTRERTPADGRKDVRFRLELYVPEDARAEVETALRAWLLFGGVGSRTRRGCGTLAAGNAWHPAADKLTTWLGNLPKRTETPDHTLLSGAQILLGAPAADANAAWEQVASFWARFRKGHVGSVPYDPMKGGRWRDYSILRDAGRGERIQLNKPFFGLPIIYQSGPYKPTLEAEETGRMASPVILKPVRLADGKHYPLVAILPAPRPTAVTIDRDTRPLSTNATDPVLRELRVTDPLDAVLAGACDFFGREARTYRF